jgi:hypothetical protein
MVDPGPGKDTAVDLGTVSATRGHLRRGLAAALAAFVLAAGAGTLLTSNAGANVPIFSFTASPSTAQAGGHPNIKFQMTFGNRISSPEKGFPVDPCDCSDAKSIFTDFPGGVVGDPHATPICTQVEFGSAHCPVDSQVGVSAFGFGLVPVYNLEPAGGQAGLLGLTVPLLHFPVYTIISARTGGDYGLKASVEGIGIHYFPLGELQVKLWGVPASPSNDPMRFHFGTVVCYGFEGEDEATVDWTQLLGHSSCEDPKEFGPQPSNSPQKPYLDNPTSCGEALETHLEILSYDNGTDSTEAPWPATTGCDQLTFNPSLYAQPTAHSTDSASGLDVDLSVPQNESPTVPSSSEIHALTVTMPPGMTINPNAADGKSACADTEAEFGTPLEARCPEYAKVGTLTLDSTALPGPIPGFIYLGEPKPGDRYRLFLTADGFGTHVKLSGSVQPDPGTGQLTISFPDLPQSPFSDFDMHFFGSERGLLATPPHCGTYQVTSTFTPWDNVLPTQTSSQPFTVSTGPNGGPCPPAPSTFNPTFHAGVASNTAGAHSPFSIELNRPDGDQRLASLSVTPPPGLLATLKGIPYCSDSAIAAAMGDTGLAQQASPACPAASQIGTAITGAGAGTHPLYVPGTVYLAGPYKGEPLSLVVVTPALSGPYDLGNAVVRAALHVDPSDARITAVTDPLPQVLSGIPLRLRSIRVALDRKGFTLNPTNCSDLSVGAQAHGTEGAVAGFNEHFQLANCAILPFAPKLAVSLSGGMKRTSNPALSATLAAPAGSANLAATSVALPHTLLLDNSHINNTCTKPELLSHTCPASSLIGSATAVTPLLDAPLQGPVYLTVGYGHKLPDVVADLNGQIRILLDGRIDTDKKGGLRTTFAGIPDAPVSKFTLNLKGGGKGLLVNSKNLCAARQVAIEKMTGQNGKRANLNATIGTNCGAGGKKARRRSAGSHVRSSRGSEG